MSYRDKTIDTVLGPVTIGRAWYHCAACGHGLAPKDAELGVAGQTMSPGLAKMTARAAAAVPFAAGAALVGELAGIEFTGRRLGRWSRQPGKLILLPVNSAVPRNARRRGMSVPATTMSA